jgi:hypothetical protein
LPLDFNDLKFNTVSVFLDGKDLQADQSKKFIVVATATNSFAKMPKK